MLKFFNRLEKTRNFVLLVFAVLMVVSLVFWNKSNTGDVRASPLNSQETVASVSGEKITVGELMRHDLQGLTISPDADALQALAKMQRTGSSRLLITEGDHLVGIISLKDLLRFLNLKLQLEGSGNAAVEQKQDALAN